MQKKYYKRLTPAQEKFVIKRMQEEWQVAERALKTHERIKRAKEMGIETGKFLLGLGLVAGVAVIAAVAPNVFAAFGNAGHYRRHIAVKDFKQELRRGSAHHYWEYKKMGEGRYEIRLTGYGRQIALRNALKEFRLHPRSVWDGKWRMVIFDIEKKNSGARDMLRRKLHEIGMYPLQESVFVFPYPCTEEVMMWVELFCLEKDVEILETQFITNRETELLKIFQIATP